MTNDQSTHTPTGYLSVVFLADKENPTKLVMLRRSLDDDFAAGFYTGVGGKMEKGEDIQTCATRELQEETDLSGIMLTEFARVDINNGHTMVCYFFGLFPGGDLPSCNEGNLEWANLADIPESLKFIPTTKILIEEWKKREWNRSPFTIELARDRLPDGSENAFAPIASMRVVDGLKNY